MQVTVSDVMPLCQPFWAVARTREHLPRSPEAPGLRLRYEFRKEFAPYVGIEWSRAFGDTADYIEARGGETDDTRFVVGLKAWF